MAPKSKKAAKAAAKLEREANELRLSGEKFMTFMHRTNRWFILNWKRVTDLCNQVDVEGLTTVSYKQFKLVLADLGFHGNAVERHLLCTILDEENQKEIHYLNVMDSIYRVREVIDENRRDKYNIFQSSEPISVFPEHTYHGVDKLVWDSDEPINEAPCYVLVDFHMLTMESSNRQGQFEQLFRSHARVHAVLEVVKRRTNTASCNLSLFNNRSLSSHSMLPEVATLAECGYPGGPRTNPMKVTLYYDYALEFSECSLLMCDHFMKTKI